MQRICVFAGSSSGSRLAYGEMARTLGTVLAARGIGLVYGGASVGLMGAVADAVLAGGGDVIGVIPRALVAREVAHHGLSDLRVGLLFNFNVHALAASGFRRILSNH